MIKTLMKNSLFNASELADVAEQNAENYTDNNLASYFANNFVVEEIQHDVVISGTSYKIDTFDASKSGYKLVGVLGAWIAHSTAMFISSIRLYSDNDNITVVLCTRNNGVTTITEQTNLHCLYVKE